MIKNIKNRILAGDSRIVKAKKNILLSIFNKGIAILISLMLVPITISYLNSEQYGIWLTLSSVVAWVSFFDVGLGHGFRNRFAEAKANGDTQLARKYVSTAYVSLFLIFGFILIVAELINPLIGWDFFLNVKTNNELLTDVISIILIGTCMGFVVNLVSIMLSADQKPALSAIIATIGQGVALLVIYILTLTTQSNMRYIAIALSWVPCIITFLISIKIFRREYKDYSPSIKYIDFSLVRNIIGLGGKFFVIQLSMLLIFQMVNIILSRVLGPNAVTEYNVAYKYFSITQMLYNIILSPFWSAYTEAYIKGDIPWMRRIYQRLSQIWYLLVMINLILLAISPIVYKMWLGDNVSLSWAVSIAMCVYLSILSFSNMYMILLNGIGKVMMQMSIYLVCAIVCIPLTYISCQTWGIPGVLIILSLVYIIQAIFSKYQLNLILNQKACGIWNR